MDDAAAARVSAVIPTRRSRTPVSSSRSDDRARSIWARLNTSTARHDADFDPLDREPRFGLEECLLY
jgi:hypothetical protein